MKARNRIKNLTHKATRLVADAFPGATCYVGKPFNAAAQKMGRIWAQQVSQAANGKIIGQLDYKTCGAIEVDEAYTSQTCPNCGTRSKQRRVYHCRTCGIIAPRDIVGAANILSVGLHATTRPGTHLPTAVRYARPVNVCRGNPASSGGHPARSSL